MIEKLVAFYDRSLAKVLKSSKIVMTVVFLLFALAVFILSKLGGEFIPSLPEGDFAVETRILPKQPENIHRSCAKKPAGADE
jgi:cobalt-zinc-cadmium resistance protein CzcA